MDGISGRVGGESDMEIREENEMKSISYITGAEKSVGPKSLRREYELQEPPHEPNESTLNPHKGAYGMACSGRTGYLVKTKY